MNVFRIKEAIQNDDVVSLKRLIEDDELEYKSNTFLGTFLHHAVFSDNISVLKYLVESKCDLNAKNSYRETPLMLSLRRGSVEHVSLLLRTRLVDIHIKDICGKSVLHNCAFVDFEEVSEFVEYFVGGGVGIDDKDTLGNTALHVACAERNINCAKALLNAGANSSVLNEEGISPLHLVVINSDLLLSQIMFDHGCDFSFPDSHGVPPILYMSVDGKERTTASDVFKFLYSKIPHLIDVEDEIYGTVAHVAGSLGSEELIKVLVDTSMTNKGRDSRVGYPPLFNAIVSDTIEGVDIMLNEMGFDILDVDKFGRNVLHIAAMTSVKMLEHVFHVSKETNKELDIERKDFDGYTVFHEKTECIQFLLEKGASIHTTSNLSGTVMDFAVCLGNDEVASTLFTVLERMYDEESGLLSSPRTSVSSASPLVEMAISVSTPDAPGLDSWYGLPPAGKYFPVSKSGLRSEGLTLQRDHSDSGSDFREEYEELHPTDDDCENVEHFACKEQEGYICKTCGTSTSILCKSCAAQCHSSHEVISMPRIAFVCRCCLLDICRFMDKICSKVDIRAENFKLPNRIPPSMVYRQKILKTEQRIASTVSAIENLTELVDEGNILFEEEAYDEYKRKGVFADWDNVFQMVFGIQNVHSRNKAIKSLTKVFAEAMKPTVISIVMELSLPPEQRTIGYLKFSANSWQMKFPDDPKQFVPDLRTMQEHRDTYPLVAYRKYWQVMFILQPADDPSDATPEISQKLLGNYNTVLASLSRIPGLSVRPPLQTVIDYMGVRVVPVALIGQDAGKVSDTWQREDMQSIETRLANELNLEQHTVRGFHRYLPGDTLLMSGANSNQAILLNPTRIFPPIPPTSRPDDEFDLSPEHRFNFSTRFRPEYMLLYDDQLSPDAFSEMGRHRSFHHNSKIYAAYDNCVDTFVSNFATFISSDLSLRSCAQLKTFLHSHGINLRFTGILRTKIEHYSARCVLLVEMLARTLRSVIYEGFRGVRGEFDSGMRKVAVNALNMAIGVNEGYEEYYNRTIKPLIMQKFPHALSNSEEEESYNIVQTHLSSLVTKRTLVERTCDLCNIILKSNLPLTPGGSISPLGEIEVLIIGPRAKEFTPLRFADTDRILKARSQFIMRRLYHLENQFDEAPQNEKITKLLERVPYLKDISGIYKKSKQFAMAEAYLLQVVDIIEKSSLKEETEWHINKKATEENEPRSPHKTLGLAKAELFLVLGRLYLMAKQFPKAIQVYEKCVNFLEAWESSENTTLSNVFHELAQLHIRESNDVAKADSMYKMAIDAAEAFLGDSDPFLIRIIENYARDIYEKGGLFSAADFLHSHALRIKKLYSESLGIRNVRSALFLAALEEFEKGWDDLAIAHIKRSRDVEASILGKAHPATADTCYLMALILQRSSAKSADENVENYGSRYSKKLLSIDETRSLRLLQQAKDIHESLRTKVGYSEKNFHASYSAICEKLGGLLFKYFPPVLCPHIANERSIHRNNELKESIRVFECALNANLLERERMHPSTARSRYNLASALFKADCAGEAMLHFVIVRDSTTKSLQTPFLLSSVFSLEPEDEVRQKDIEVTLNMSNKSIQFCRNHLVNLKGKMMKKGKLNSSPKVRYFRLTPNGLLCYYKSYSSMIEGKSCKGTIEMDSDVNLHVHILGKLVLHASSVEELLKSLQAIRREYYLSMEAQSNSFESERLEKDILEGQIQDPKSKAGNPLLWADLIHPRRTYHINFFTLDSLTNWIVALQLECKASVVS